MARLLAAGPNQRRLRFWREIAQGAPNWVPSDTIEQNTGENSYQLGGLHRQADASVGRIVPGHVPPWQRTGAPGHKQSYRMTSAVAAVVLANPGGAPAPPNPPSAPPQPASPAPTAPGHEDGT